MEGTPTALFNAASALFHRAADSELESRDPLHQEEVKAAFRSCLQCAVAVSRGEVMDADEEAEDLSAARLRYVLVPFYLAELSQMVVDDKRLQNVLRAKQYYKEFLGKCKSLRLLSGEEAKAFDREAPLRGNAKREEKIGRARKQRAAREKLRRIREQLERNEAQGVDEDTGIDEEVFREAVLLEIGIACYKALDELVLVDEELPLLERMQQMQQLERAKSDGWKQQAAHREKERQDERTAGAPQVELPPGYAAVPSTAMAGAFTIMPVTRNRRELQAGVFRPGFQQATVSIEEAGEADYREMVERQARQEAAEAKRDEVDEDDMEHYDTFKVYEERDWDTFKDDNPTGSGNTYNKA